jgi:hypothetical protein
MATVNIDNIPYDLDTLSADAKALLQSLQMADQKLAELQRDTAITQTARLTYANALKAALPAAAETTATDSTVALGEGLVLGSQSL